MRNGFGSLKAGAIYSDSSSRLLKVGSTRPASDVAAEQTARYALCPCGSGEKAKFCRCPGGRLLLVGSDIDLTHRISTCESLISRNIRD